MNKYHDPLYQMRESTIKVKKVSTLIVFCVCPCASVRARFVAWPERPKDVSNSRRQFMFSKAENWNCVHTDITSFFILHFDTLSALNSLLFNGHTAL